jgi:hypothetical protein
VAAKDVEVPDTTSATRARLPPEPGPFGKVGGAGLEGEVRLETLSFEARASSGLALLASFGSMERGKANRKSD